MSEGEKLQKVQAQAGLGSRRACEEIIAEGRVEVNGELIVAQGRRVDPERDEIRVDGMRIMLDTSHVTIALNKPKGVVSTMQDPDGRPTLAEFTAKYRTRLFHVGRLDTDTQGLILLTNDGELAHRLAHPSYGVPKTYLATVNGRVGRGLGRELKRGVELDDGIATVDSFRVLEATAQASIVELVLHDGRNRIVRRLMDAVGHPVVELVRTQVGPVQLGQLRSGRTRVIKGAELGSLMKAVHL